MKTYKVIGGFTVYEQYQINVQAKDSKDAIKKAEKIGISHWMNYKTQMMIVAL